MVQSWKSFAIGALAMLVMIITAYMLFSGTEKRAAIPEKGVEDTEDYSNKVTITPLPALRIVRGTEVPFEGKIELRQAIAGQAAQDITIVNFQATGEHADKSVIMIVWENGEVEKVYPGTKNKKFSPGRRAVKISVIGYSMHERPIFRDASRKGTLTWEIHYEPVN
ncbi:hypothetical protein SOV_02350 [Sporomusa ovata DSM 2662]|uniref:Uncharacterized protein n=1 Tax=Sporomusa ovata TaxID=2378 RepID=A0A0U1KZK0_9FIRM|nr:hypothetical protein [Sporomusa ovata]EQB27916.1 hypothetical protein SOV_2c08270 [Sporomusa ovata DSM 2662]CQR72851.1 hypothetical protein SpAn4DRAFT_3311 [Sporomusa ovata]